MKGGCMMRIKRVVLRLFLLLEVVVFGYIYLFGNNGLHALTKLKQETVLFEQEVDQLAREVTSLEDEIETWESDDFYKEKIAREQLQMARKNDEIYMLN